MPIQFLRQLISFYGDNMQAFLPSYLELSLDAFSRQQEQMRSQFATGKFPAFTPGGGFLEEQVRQNMLMFDRAMKMFTPFAYAKPGEAGAAPAAAPTSAAKPESAADSSLEDLKTQIAAMQSQIEKLANK